MYPLLAPGEGLIIDRLAYHVDRPARGDLVLAAPPDSLDQKLIKLVAGLPGEDVAAASDRLWINGRRLVFPQPVVVSPPGRWRLGEEQYFLISYATTVGTDSRHFGPVPRRALLGRAWLVYRPTSRRRRLARLRLALDE